MTDEETHDDDQPERTVPGSTGEGDIDQDRQDPPRPEKTDGDEPELDGTKATPGDEAS